MKEKKQKFCKTYPQVCNCTSGDCFADKFNEKIGVDVPSGTQSRDAKRIYRAAYFNTTNVGKDKVVDATTDSNGKRWIVLNSYNSLLEVKDSMNKDCQYVLEDEKDLLKQEILEGTLFCFYFEKSQLCWER